MGAEVVIRVNLYGHAFPIENWKNGKLGRMEVVKLSYHLVLDGVAKRDVEKADLVIEPKVVERGINFLSKIVHNKEAIKKGEESVEEMIEEIICEVLFNFGVESTAVKEHSCVVVKNMDSVNIRCLPGDLVSQIDIQLDSLKELNDAIRLNDLRLPENIHLVSETNDMIVSVIEPRIQEEAEEEVEEKEVPEEAKDEEKKEDEEEKKDEIKEGPEKESKEGKK